MTSAFKTSVKLPKQYRCRVCRAPHGMAVYRLRQDLRVYCPAPLPAEWAPLYYPKQDVIDLLASDTCRVCSLNKLEPRAL